MQLQATLDLTEVSQGDLWEFAHSIPENAHLKVTLVFEEGFRFSSEWIIQDIELLAQWNPKPHLVSKSATIDLRARDLRRRILALVEETPENALFDPIVAAYDEANEMPLERLSPEYCTLVASWEQDPTVPLLDL